MSSASRKTRSNFLDHAITMSYGIIMNDKISRREFLEKAALLGGAGLILPVAPNFLAQAKEPPKEKEPPLDKIIAVCNGKNPAKLTKGVIDILGGMKKFVKKGDTVLVKPNIAWDRKPELAATTNPEMVTTIIKECLAAGAKKVTVLDRSCDNAKRCYKTSGIEDAAKDAGAEVVLIEERPAFYKKVKFPKGKIIKEYDIVKEAVECNVFINVPIAKHHSYTKLTLGIKNLMGLMGGNRGEVHKDIDQKLADVLTVIRPHLTIIDAYRVLLKHGPTGGSEEDVKLAGKVIGGVDPVAVDTYAASLEVFKNVKGKDEIGYIKTAAEMGLGEKDLSKMKIIEKEI